MLNDDWIDGISYDEFVNDVGFDLIFTIIYDNRIGFEIEEFL